MVFERFKKIILNKNQKTSERSYITPRLVEENKIQQILAKGQKNNCIVIGRKGVGKTCLLESIKRKISKHIIVIDDVHLLKNEDALALKEKIINNDVQCVLSTTYVVYKSYNDFDGFFAKSFTPILLAEPNNFEALEILQQKADELESLYGLFISPSTFAPLIELSQRYLYDKNMPLSFIEVLDEICNKKSILFSEMPVEIENLIKHITELKAKSLSSAQKIELNALEIKYETLYKNWQQKITDSKRIEAIDIYQHFNEASGVSVEKLKISFKDKILTLEEKLNKKVLHQREAVAKIAKAIENKYLKDAYKKEKPLSFLFRGQGGVGKYKAAKEIATFLFDDIKNMVTSPSNPYQVIITENVDYSNNKGLKNSILIYEKENDFIDEVIDFAPLARNGARDIAKQMLDEMLVALGLEKMSINIEEQVYMFLLKKAYDGSCLKNLRQIIESELKAKMISIEKENIDKKTIYIYFEQGGLEIKIK